MATRAIHKVVYEEGLGIDGQPMVYLDLTHIDRATLDRKLEGILEIYEKFVGDDPRDVPMKIFPGMHYTMGGLWVDFNQMTNIPGIFAAGECEYQYHGANRLGANSLLSCIFGGFRAGPNALQYAKSLPARRRRRPRRRAGPPGRDQRQAAQERRHGESLQAMARVGRDHDRARHRHPLQQGVQAGRRKDRRAARPLQEREPLDRSQWANTSFAFARQLKNMLELSRVRRAGSAAARRVARRALQARLPRPQRREVPEDHQGQLHRLAEGPRFEYEEVDTQYIKPRPRRYDATK
jgi:succinate dehydrogenase / fumarate reductase flavoprotein subunit